MPTETFTNDGQEVTWTVPDGVTEVTVEAWGAHGAGGNAYASATTSDTKASNSAGSGGVGSKAEAVVSVSPGDTVVMEIAAAASGTGGGYPNGTDGETRQGGFGEYANAESGGGGGSTNVKINGTVVVSAAGGGGGGAASSVLSYQYDEIDSDASGGADASGRGANDAYAETTLFDGPISASANGGTAGGSTFVSSTDDSASNSRAAAAGGAGGGSSGTQGGAGGADVTVENDAAVSAAAGGAGGSNYFGPSTSNTSTVDSASAPSNYGNGEVQITYVQPPDPPTALSASVGSRQVDLTWENDPDGYDSIEVYRAMTSGGETTNDYTLIDTVGGTEASYTDAGLLDGERYFYRVRGISGGNSVGWSNEGDGVTTLPAPTSLTHPTTGDESAGYAWTANHNNGETRIEYRPAGEGDDWTTHETVARDVESATVDGLLNGEQYESRVVAQTEHAETEDT